MWARIVSLATAVQLLLQGKELAAPKTTPIARRETYQVYKRKKQAADTLTPRLDTPAKLPATPAPARPCSGMHCEGCICSAADPAPSPGLGQGRVRSPHSCSQWVSTPWPVVTSSSRMISTASIAAPPQSTHQLHSQPCSGSGVTTAHARARPVTLPHGRKRPTCIQGPEALLYHRSRGATWAVSACQAATAPGMHKAGRAGRRRRRVRGAPMRPFQVSALLVQPHCHTLTGGGSTRRSRSYACSSSSTRPARSAEGVRTGVRHTRFIPRTQAHEVQNNPTPEPRVGRTKQ